MIEFYGTISNDNKAKAVKKTQMFFSLFACSFLVPLFIACSIFFLLNNKDKQFFYLCIGFAGIIVVLALLSIIPLSQQRIKQVNLPQRIILKKEDDIAYQFVGSTERARKLSKVRKINDYGDCYFLIFDRLWDSSNVWVCQKDLLMQGSLEEFEAMFEGKIIRKTKNNII